MHRSDGSGTTFNFTNYLSKVSPEWKAKVGRGTAVAWPDGVGGKGNEGVAAYVKQIKGSIGYVEFAYALQNKMTYARCRTRPASIRPRATRRSRPPPPAPTGRTRQDFYLIITNAPGENSWPITASTFILLHSSRRTSRRTPSR